jgi:hypothetical protein
MPIWYELGSNPYFIIGGVLLLILGIAIRVYYESRRSKSLYQGRNLIDEEAIQLSHGGPPFGGFDAMTAFRAQSVEDVIGSILEYADRYQVSAAEVPLTAPLDHQQHAIIYFPPGDWMIVWWPNYFNIHNFPLVRAIAKKKGWLVSTIHVYDSDYWEHLCCSGEIELHTFCSWPSYWKEAGEEDYDLFQNYDPDPIRLAETFEINPDIIRPYLVDVAGVKDNEQKAFEDDEFPLADYWVFVDFWRRLGIPYPENSDIKGAVYLGNEFMDKLPTT